MSKDTPKLVNHGLNALSQLIESDNYASLVDLNLIENLNTNQSLNYIKLENNLHQLTLRAQSMGQLKSEFARYDDILLEIEQGVERIENVVQELDGLSKEIRDLS
ncbi:hypothetical protein DICA3_A06722 [Diutina catenulata]